MLRALCGGACASGTLGGVAPPKYVHSVAGAWNAIKTGIQIMYAAVRTSMSMSQQKRNQPSGFIMYQGAGGAPWGGRGIVEARGVGVGRRLL